MNKFFVSALASAGLAVAAAASQATVVTYELLPGTTVYTTPPGVPADSTNDATITDVFRPSSSVSNPQSYAVPSVLKLGDDVTSPGTGSPNTFATWNTGDPISFDFELSTPLITSGTPHFFTASGTLSGTVGYDGTGVPYSQAHVDYTKIVDTTNGNTSVGFTIDPNNGVAAVELTTTINGATVMIWIDEKQSKAIPGDTNTHEGFINANTVPEPGSVAMIVGMGVSGGLLLRRKRRA